MQRGEVEDGEYAYGSYLISRWRWWAWRMVTWWMVKKMNIMTWILIYMVPLVLPQFKYSSNTTLVALNQYIHMHYSFFHILTTYPFLVVQTNVFVTVFLSHPHSRKLAPFSDHEPLWPQKPILTYDIPLPPPICLISFSLLVLLFPLLPFFLNQSHVSQLFPGFLLSGMSKLLSGWELNLASFKLTACACLCTPPPPPPLPSTSPPQLPCCGCCTTWKPFGRGPIPATTAAIFPATSMSILHGAHVK